MLSNLVKAAVQLYYFHIHLGWMRENFHNCIPQSMEFQIGISISVRCLIWS